MNDAPHLPWPFKPADVHPYLNVEIAPGEYVTVVLAGDYKHAISEYLQLRDDYMRLRNAAAEVERASRDLQDQWNRALYGNH